MEGVDPEDRALLYVQQYLSEHGYSDALAALEACTRRYDNETLPEGSQIMRLVWAELEEQLSSQSEAGAGRHGEEEALLRSGLGDYPCEPCQQVQGLHSSSITCIALLPGGDDDVLLTGAASGIVQRFTMAGQHVWGSPVSSGGVLALAPHPEWQVLAVGSMGGQVSCVDVRSGDLLASACAHSKYVVSVAWCNGGQRLLSASWDHSIAVHELRMRQGVEGAQELQELQQVAKVPFAAAVQGVALLPGGSVAAVAVRDTCYLRMYDTAALRELPPVNMNAAGDEHVSFCACHLALSPCGRFLLVSTDGSRLLVLRTADWSPLHMLHGLPVERFHQPCAAWHRDSSYIFAAGAGGQLLVFHVGSAKVVARIRAHDKALRGMAYSARRNLLTTCSFDKTVKVFQEAGATGVAAVAGAAGSGQ